MKTYYELLGVPNNASQKEIKTAYHQRGLKLHPDKGGDPTTYTLIVEAYEHLSDPEKRAAYDNQLNRNAGASTADSDIFTNFGYSSWFDAQYAINLLKEYPETPNFRQYYFLLADTEKYAFLIEALKLNGMWLEHVSSFYRSQPKIVRFAIQQNGLAYRYSKSPAADDMSIIFSALKHTPKAFGELSFSTRVILKIF